MNTLNLLVAIIVVLLGLIPLRLIYTWEQALVPFGFTYFAVQHFVFGFGGFLLALFDRGYLYENAQGLFLWSDGFMRLQLIHLATLYFAVVGTWVATTGLRQPRAMLSQRPHNAFGTVAESIGSLLQRICYITLFLNILITLVSWFTKYNDIGTLFAYFIAVLVPVSRVTFFFWGLWWVDAGKNRLIFGLWLVPFAITQFASGNRGWFLYGLLLFSFGLLLRGLSQRLQLRPRTILFGIVSMPIVGWLMVSSDSIRNTYQSRTPTNAEEWVQRISSLLELRQDPEVNQGSNTTQYGSLFEQVGFRVASRVFEVSALNVVARTPEQIPYVGWRDSDWQIVATNWLPTFFFSNLPTSEDAGVLFLRAYGWPINLGPGGTAWPATMLADAWRRFGWLGVLLVHFGLAFFLTRLSILMERLTARKSAKEGQQGVNIFWFLFSSGLLATFAFSYTSDMITFLTFLPRLFLIVAIYAGAVAALVRFLGEKSSANEVPLYRLAPRLRNG